MPGCPNDTKDKHCCYVKKFRITIVTKVMCLPEKQKIETVIICSLFLPTFKSQ